MLSFVPSCSSSFSLLGWNSVVQITLNTRNATSSSDDQPDGRASRARRAQAELPRAHRAPAELRAEHRRQHERQVLHERVGDRQARRRVRARDVHAERERRDVDEQRRRPPRARARRAAPPAPSTAASRRRRADGRRSTAPAAAGGRGDGRPGGGRRSARLAPSLRHPVPGGELRDEERPSAAAEHDERRAPRARMLGQPGRRARCSAGTARRRKRGSDISGCARHRVGQRQRERGDHVRAVGERQPCAARRTIAGTAASRNASSSRLCSAATNGLPRRRREVHVRAAGRTAAGARPRTPRCSAVPHAHVGPAKCRPQTSWA